MKNKKFIALLSSVLVVVSINTAFAQTQNEQPVREAVKEKIQEKVEAKCDKAQNVIAKIVEKYTTTRRDHVQSLNNLRKKYDEMLTKLTEQGYDTSKLKTYSKEMEKRITTYASDLSSFMQALKESQSLSCGTGDSKYADAVKKTKDLLKKVRTDIQEIKNYYHDTVRPALLDLKKEVKENTKDKAAK